MFRRLFSRKALVRVVFALALLVTLLLALLAFENWRGVRAWARYRAAAEARGEKLWIEQFVQPPLPDEENFAAIPILRDAFAKPSDPKKSSFALPLPEDEKKRPAFADRIKGERIDLAKWRDAFRAANLLSDSGDNPATEVLQALARYEPELQQFRDGAKRRGAHFPVNWSDGAGALLPHLAPFREAARIVTLRMEAHLTLGESEAAYADFRDGLALYRALEREPVLICGLTRVAILMQLETAVWDGLVGDHWKDPELRRLATDFAGLRLLEDWRFAVASERGGSNRIIENLVARPHEFPAIARGAERFAIDQVWLLFPRGWMRQNQVKINEWYDLILAKIDPDASVIVPGTPHHDFDRVAAGSMGARQYYALLMLLMPAFGSVENSYLAAYTSAQQARTACALQLHRHAHGVYPDELEALVPALLEAVPRDICDGAPLRYRRTATGYELWSIAANRKDDGAKGDPEKSLRLQPDWVWRL